MKYFTDDEEMKELVEKYIKKVLCKFHTYKSALILTVTIKNNIYLPLAKTRNFYKLLLNFIRKT